MIAEVLTNDEELPAVLPEPLSPQTVTRCLDLCTGSGALAIILADIFPHSKVDAVDISTDALEVAKKNVSSFELVDRVSLIHSDMFTSLSRDNKYDIIVCNPPYVTQKVRPNFILSRVAPQMESATPTVGLLKLGPPLT